MSNLAEFFLNNIPEVYFFYGLSFFSMGLAVLLEAGHTSELDFASALRPLAGFGLLHGSHEWIEMFLILHPEISQNPDNTWITPFRLAMLAISFIFLVLFGAGLISGPARSRTKWSMILMVAFFWGVGLAWVNFTQPAGASRILAADVYTRYSLAIPGAVLTVWGLALQRQKFFQAGMRSFGNDVAMAAVAFGLYGGIGQLFASSSVIFPSYYLNADLFVRTFGIPIQVFRAMMAAMAAFFIIRSLRAFEVENRRQIESLREAQLAERQRLEATRAELLHRTVKAQETERQRIARELHDETGQTLTALGMGLRALSTSIPNNPERAIHQAQQLEAVATSGIEELQRLVSGLHPPQLDDLGLIAALRWYCQETQERYNLPVTLSVQNTGPKLPEDVRVVLFRIAQEALTNIIRHANAKQALVQLENTPDHFWICVEDNGCGFDTQATLDSIDMDYPHWGLLGMMERASLIQAACQIISRPGLGTRVEVEWRREQDLHA